MRDQDKIENLVKQVQGLELRILDLEQRELERIEHEIEQAATRYKRMTITPPPPKPSSRWKRFKDWALGLGAMP